MIAALGPVTASPVKLYATARSEERAFKNAYSYRLPAAFVAVASAVALAGFAALVFILACATQAFAI